MRITICGSLDAPSGAIGVASNHEGHWNLVSLQEIIESIDLVPDTFKDVLRIKVKKAQFVFHHHQDLMTVTLMDPFPPLLGMATLVFVRRPADGAVPANASQRGTTYCSIEDYVSDVIYPADSMQSKTLVGATKAVKRRQNFAFKSDNNYVRNSQCDTLINQDITKIVASLIQDMSGQSPIRDYQVHVFWVTGQNAYDNISDQDGYPLETDSIAGWQLIIDYELESKK